MELVLSNEIPTGNVIFKVILAIIFNVHLSVTMVTGTKQLRIDIEERAFHETPETRVIKYNIRF